MPKFSQYAEAVLAEAPVVFSVIKAAAPVIKEFITQQKAVVGPYVTTLKTDVAALKSASDLMKVPKAIAIGEDLFDLWPLVESAFGEVKTLLIDDYTTLKGSVTKVITPTALPAPATIAAAPVYVPIPASLS